MIQLDIFSSLILYGRCFMGVTACHLMLSVKRMQLPPAEIRSVLKEDSRQFVLWKECDRRLRFFFVINNAVNYLHHAEVSLETLRRTMSI